MAVAVASSAVAPVYADEVETGTASIIVLQENNDGLQNSTIPEEEHIVKDENTDSTKNAENAQGEESNSIIILEDGEQKPQPDLTTEQNEETINSKLDTTDSNPIQMRSIGLSGDYNDGTYEGTGSGFKSEVAVEVTIANNSITQIKVISQDETPSKWLQALSLVNSIINANSTDVDSVSGATKSSEGIKAAVNDALLKALKTDTQVFAGGNGSQSNPYIIENVEQLKRFAGKVNSGNDYNGKYITLSADVTLGGQEWTPIGTAENTGFSGNFSGAGNSVEGLTISSGATQYAGLFGYLGTGAGISDLELTNVAISTTTGAAIYAGSIAGRTANDVVINNCRIDGTVSAFAGGSAKMSWAGGVIGSLGMGGVVANCYANVSVTAEAASAAAYAGGVVGASGNKCVLLNAASLGNVSARAEGTSLGVAGGIVGSHGGTAYNAYSLGAVTSESADTTKSLAGGISGMVTPNTAIINAYYNNINSNGFMTVNSSVTGYITNNVKAVSQGDLSSSGFVEKLNNGLKNASVASAAAIIAAANKPNMGDLQNAASSVKSLYAWESGSSSIKLSNRAFVDDTINTDIFERGNGTEENPYIIKTEEQLRAFAKSLSKDITYAGLYIALDGDIDVSSEQWISIGLGHFDFKGIFDGRGHAVKGMFIGAKGSPYQEANTDSKDESKLTTFYGFFGVIGENGVVKNLSIENALISVKNYISSYSGLLAGFVDKGYIDSCSASGYVYGDTTHQKANTWAGGLIGQTVRGGVINSWTKAEVYCVAIGGLAEAGAFIGMTNRSVVANCLALGDAGGKASRENGNEGMPAVSSFIGVNGGKMANCYSVGNMKADSFSQYVGSIAGWSTGIARQFVSYYNSDAVQNSNGTISNPVIAVGFMVSAGVNDEGEAYDGTYHVGIKAKSSAELNSQVFADLLNSNHNAFPLDIVNGESSNIGEQNAMGLPGFMKLRAWKLVDGIVLPVGEQVGITYKDMTPEFEPEKLNIANGTYYGRALGPSGKYIYVEMTVKDGRMTGIRVTEHGEGEALENVAAGVIEAVISSQSYAKTSDDNEVVKALKSAIATAAQKAENRDLTGYGQVAPSIFAGGTGTKTNPYVINTANQLKAFAESVNADEHYEGKFIKLGSDISLAGMNWLPVGGSGAYGFRGTFDGNNKVISNMTIGSNSYPEEYCKSVGFFANLEAAKIKNLGIENAAVYHKYMGDSIAYTGLLAGYVVENAGDEGYIDFCYAKGIINSFSAKQNDSGGLVGAVNRGTIANCYTDVTIIARSRDGYCYAGGLAGLPNRAVIINNYAFGSINGTGNGARIEIGGIAGLNAAVSVNNYANVSLTSENTTVDIGGFSGRVSG
ncbi:MAG: FMN-binding domain protein, partial [Eubacterium sp.]|nr:FMN-binding domain protein [Eubacterium sp.]